MSSKVIVDPLLPLAWDMFSELAASIAAKMGYTINLNIWKIKRSDIESIEIPLDNNPELKEHLAEQKQLFFSKDNITIHFYADLRGKCFVKVHGRKIKKDRLLEIGQDMIHHITQQYVHHKILSELAHKGYTVVSNEKNDSNAIRILVRKFHEG